MGAICKFPPSLTPSAARPTPAFGFPASTPRMKGHRLLHTRPSHQQTGT